MVERVTRLTCSPPKCLELGWHARMVGLVDRETATAFDSIRPMPHADSPDTDALLQRAAQGDQTAVDELLLAPPASAANGGRADGPAFENAGRSVGRGPGRAARGGAPVARLPAAAADTLLSLAAADRLAAAHDLYLRHVQAKGRSVTAGGPRGHGAVGRVADASGRRLVSSATSPSTHMLRDELRGACVRCLIN